MTDPNLPSHVATDPAIALLIALIIFGALVTPLIVLLIEWIGSKR